MLARSRLAFLAPLLAIAGCSAPSDGPEGKSSPAPSMASASGGDSAVPADAAPQDLRGDAAGAASEPDGAFDAGSQGSSDSATEPRDAEPVTARDAGLPEACAALAAGAAGPDVWSAGTTIALVDPRDHGAAVDDDVDDTDALRASVAALPAEGGIVLFPSGTLRKQQQQWRIEKSHVLLWSPNRRGTLEGRIAPRGGEGGCGTRQQATIFRRTVGGGIYGLRMTSNAVERMSCAEDAQIVLDSVDGAEVVGVEVAGAATNGVFAWSSNSAWPASRNIFLEGNYIHHTWADSIHHTRGTRRSACWRNAFFNEAPSKGDDGIACVTYDPGAARCGEMEWWDNRYLGGAHGRGMAVVGGEDILIHHNWIIGSAGAGLIVASESSYDTPGSDRVRMTDNWLVDSPNGTVNNGHSAILVSGNNPAAEPLRDITAVDNVIINPAGGRVDRSEGDTVNVVLGNHTDTALLPGSPPTLQDVAIQDTTVLKTRDVSFVPESQRSGLYRIHARRVGADEALEFRFEYLVHSSDAALCDWLQPSTGPHYVVESRVLEGTRYTLLLSSTPLEQLAGVTGVDFDALRQGDRDGTLGWLWQRVDQADYAP